MKFKVFEIADVWSGHLTDQDLTKLASPDHPLRIGTFDSADGEELGYICTVPLDGNDEKFGYQYTLRQFGMSEVFIRIVDELRKQKIPYFRVDSVCEEVEGLAGQTATEKVYRGLLDECRTMLKDSILGGFPEDELHTAPKELIARISTALGENDNIQSEVATKKEGEQ